jgi:hypothetical protein
MRTAFIVLLVVVWSLIDYPTGFWLFVACFVYWALQPLRPSHRG